ncbi:hypothetical protein [Pseudomonas putida]|uniref:hypothetical protein n=1 Tax=Pseudomonas putida TaxID=303 RepID=UPI001E287A29|nr:hypothetical protein [Pseudomonas putida]
MGKRTIIGLIEAGEPLIRQALEAIRAYHEAQDAGKPDEEVERLHLLSESLYQAVCDYQLLVKAKSRGEELLLLH